MTDREKQIEEMTEIIKADYKEWLDITGCLSKGTSYYYECLGGAEDSAKKLYDNGYRKMDEIKKQVAREIINDLFNACDASQYDCVEPDYIFYLAKKYGVEKPTNNV